MKTGDIVKLSAWGIEMQMNRKSKNEGVVVWFKPYGGVESDGNVCVLWSGCKKNDVMHVSHVELIGKKKAKSKN